MDPLNDGSYDVDQAELTVSEDRMTLRTRAVIFDQLEAISSPTFEKDGLPFAHDDSKVQRQSFANDTWEKCNWLADCEHISNIASCELKLRTEQMRLERFLECYACGAGYDEGFDYVTTYQSYLRKSAMVKAAEERDEDIATSYRNRCSQLGVHPAQPGLGVDDDTIVSKYTSTIYSVAQEWLKTERDSRFGRRFFRSGLHKIGWVPQSARPGDELCVVFGYAAPFVIRKVAERLSDQAARYRLLGACYVHDNMDGEIFLNDELARVTIELV